MKINLNVGTDVGVSSYVKPKMSIRPGSTGGMIDSADNIFGGVSGMGRIYEDDLELDEDDLYELDDELLYEFITLDQVLNVGRSALQSIPIFGDAYALVSFLLRIRKLRKKTRNFTKYLSKITDTRIGNDFLEPENINLEDSLLSEGFSDEDALDDQLDNAVFKIKNLQMFPELKISHQNIIILGNKYDDITDELQKVTMDFIGFADAFFAQKGFLGNVALGLLEPVDFVNWFTTKYAQLIDKMTSDKGALSKMMNTVFSALSFLGKPLDMAGNLDLFLNKRKLKRFEKINSIFKHYKEVDTEREIYQSGLSPLPGTELYRKVKSAPEGEEIDIETLDDNEKSSKLRLWNRLFQNLFEEKDYNTSLQELLDEEDENIDEFNTVGVVAPQGMGPNVPLGRNADNTRTTRKQKRDRDNKARQMYLRENHAWNHRTLGRIKFK